MTAKTGMRLQFVTIASAAVFALAGSAWAQSSPPSTGVPGAPPLSAQPAPRPAPPAAANPLTLEDISKIKGAPVYGSDDKRIGTVSTVLMRPASKTIDRLVVGEGGLLGVGTHYVALPIDAFAWDSQAAAFKIAKTAEDLKGMPEWNEQIGAMPEPGNAPAETPRSGGGLLITPTPDSPRPLTPAPDSGRT
jgi:hypothetical protein